MRCCRRQNQGLHSRLRYYRGGQHEHDKFRAWLKTHSEQTSWCPEHYGSWVGKSDHYLSMVLTKGILPPSLTHQYWHLQEKYRYTPSTLSRKDRWGIWRSTGRFLCAAVESHSGYDKEHKGSRKKVNLREKRHSVPLSSHERQGRNTPINNRGYEKPNEENPKSALQLLKTSRCCGGAHCEGWG